MENNKLPTREELKTYFETDKYPTQNQFAELIESFRHKEDILTNREAVILANSLESINTAYFTYNGNNLQREFPVVLSSQGAEDHLIKVGDTKGNVFKRYFLGSAPYTIKAKEFPNDGLEANEYYFLYLYIDQSVAMNRLFGNNLPKIPDGFELASVEARKFYLTINKQSYGQKINIVNTSVKFINNTQETILYKTESGYWSHYYTAKDIITEHYHLWDYISFNYKADLRKSNKSVECKVYNADNNNLLTTGYLYAGQIVENSWGGGQILGIRNVRIECNYQ